jgi:hypothetical protein
LLIFTHDVFVRNHFGGSQMLEILRRCH